MANEARQTPAPLQTKEERATHHNLLSLLPSLSGRWQCRLFKPDIGEWPTARAAHAARSRWCIELSGGIEMRLEFVKASAERWKTRSPRLHFYVSFTPYTPCIAHTHTLAMASYVESEPVWAPTLINYVRAAPPFSPAKNPLLAGCSSPRDQKHMDLLRSLSATSTAASRPRARPNPVCSCSTLRFGCTLYHQAAYPPAICCFATVHSRELASKGSVTFTQYTWALVSGHLVPSLTSR